MGGELYVPVLVVCTLLGSLCQHVVLFVGFHVILFVCDSICEGGIVTYLESLRLIDWVIQREGQLTDSSDQSTISKPHY